MSSSGSSSLNVPPSNVSSLAWNQRAQRLRKRNGAGRTKRQQRLLAIFVAGMVGLILIVVHVELSLLHKATSASNKFSSSSVLGKNLVMEPGSSSNRRMSSSSHHIMTHHEKQEPPILAHPSKTAPLLDKKVKENDVTQQQEVRKEEEEFHKKAHVERHEEEKQPKSSKKASGRYHEVQQKKDDVQEQHAQMDRHPEEKGNAGVAAEKALKKDDNHDTPQEVATENNAKKQNTKLMTEGDEGNTPSVVEQAKVAEAAKESKLETADIRADDHSDLKALIARTEQHLHMGPAPKTADFCDPSLAAAPSGPAIAPAVVVLGMEDTSTNLFWHVLSHAIPEGYVVPPSRPQKSNTLQYGALAEMDPMKEDQFWESLPFSDKGAWVTEAICGQQSNEAKILGFPWLTLGDMSKNGHAIETLRAIAKLPKDSVKVIRYRRNVLDMISRQEQHLMEVREGQPSHSITLDKKALLKSLTHWNARQKAVDKFLEEAQIPHITVDHEMLFPFNDWRDLVNVTTIVEKYQVPLNVKIDFTKIAPDERPPEPSKMELEWTKVLDYVNIKQPTTLFDLFYSAYSFSQRGAVFWRQQQSLTNYAAVQQVLTGTHFQDLLRNMEYHHDFYGCACNDKEANRARLWKAFKMHKTKEEADALPAK